MIDFMYNIKVHLRPKKDVATMRTELLEDQIGNVIGLVRRINDNIILFFSFSPNSIIIFLNNSGKLINTA